MKLLRPRLRRAKTDRSATSEGRAVVADAADVMVVKDEMAAVVVHAADVMAAAAVRAADAIEDRSPLSRTC